jgi:hypothetical protein
MARHIHLRRLADDWPVLFAVGVAIWFAVAGLGATGLSFSRDHSNSQQAAAISDEATTDDVATTKKPENSPVIVGPLKVKVVSFRVHPDKKTVGTLNGDVTLELRNTTKENVTFHPSQLSIQRVGQPGRVTPKGSVDIGVSPNLPVTAPLDFTLTPDPNARYQMVYAGQVVYQGLPF